MRYYIVDAFTDQPFGGNPAGVVLLENGAFPSEQLMQRIAAELRYSETAFVQQNEKREFTIRYFTPAGEVPLCGHATIASFGVLFQEGILEDGTECLNHTKAGDLQVIAGKNVMMQMASPEAMAIIEDQDRLYQIMGSEREGVELLPQIVSTGLPDIIMPVRDVDALQSLHPDMKALSKLSEELDVTGVHAFALSTDGLTAHVRNFAPRYDIDEESATGTANAALTYFLYINNLLTPPNKCTYLQGEAMQRPSVITTKLEVNNDCEIWVGGESYIVAEGKLFV
ncbi:MAG: PhzF family phenazine biosynthesis protein [Bacteroidales bacterium]|nr:PhzF family phenazine biosynthesis protein [Bacteroidales bacterium]